MPENFLNTKVRKKKQKRNLQKFFVEIEDTTPKASNFLNISQLGDELSLGKNAFIIRGSEKIVSGSPILVEIIDSKGEVIYSETHDYEESNGRIVSVYVYNETPTGPAEITIMTEVEEYKDGNKISEDLRGIYNYRWTKTLNVNPNVYNINNVRFERKPKVRSSLQKLNKLNISYDGNNSRETKIDSKSFSPDISLSGVLKLDKHEDTSSIIKIDETCGSSFNLLRGMEGGTLKFRNSKSNFSNVSTNEDFLFDIIKIFNNKKLKIKARESVRKKLPKRVEVNCNQDFEINFLREDPTNVNVLNSEKCFVQLELDDLSTISGAVLRTSIYVREFDSDNSFTYVGDFEIDPTELMVDFKSNDTPRNKKIGLFLSNEEINNYLEPLNKYSVLERDGENLLNSVNIKRKVFNDSGTEIIENIDYNTNDNGYGGAQVSGFVDQSVQFIDDLGGSDNKFGFDDDSDNIIGFKIPIFDFSGDIELEKNVKYNLKFDYLLNNKENKIESSKFGLFLRIRRVDDNNNEYEIEERLNNFRIPNGKYGSKSVDLEFESSINSLSGDSSDIQLIIKVEEGNWFFSNFSLVPTQKAGFSPDFTTLNFSLDSTILNQVGNSLEFRADLFDLNKNRIPVELRTESGLNVSNCG